MTITEIKEVICDEYCRHPFNTETQAELSEHCRECPLNELRDDKALSQKCVGSTHKTVGNALDMRCEDAISRQYIKQKLQEHHDFFVNAYGGFSNLPQNDKARVDEITNCIAEVVNAPPARPPEKTGHWIEENHDEYELWICSECGAYTELDMSEEYGCGWKFCPKCGAKMESEEQTE